MLRALAIGTFLLALALWALFGFLAYHLHGARAELAVAEAESRAQSVRGESAARLRAAVRDTETERAALERAVQTPVLEAVEVVESAALRAGASDVVIGNAMPAGGTFPDGTMAVSVIVNAEGNFSGLARTISVFETLPLPSVLEHFELEHIDETWHLSARIRLIVAASDL